MEEYLFIKWGNNEEPFHCHSTKPIVSYLNEATAEFSLTALAH